MRLHFGLAAMLLAALCGCGGGAGGSSGAAGGADASSASASGEPSEDQMREAMLYEMNHPPGVTVSEPITIKFFKKEACDKPTGQGYNCTFDVQVLSTNLGASMYNNIPGANFYKDSSGKWQMRPPF